MTDSLRYFHAAMRELHHPAALFPALAALLLHFGFGDATAQSASEAELAMRKFRVAPGFRTELYASEPLIANPVSFAFDEKGRAYVVETHRRRSSVFDIRNHPGWLDHDFSFRTVLDRSNFFNRVLVPGNTNLPARITVDRNGDGVFDVRDLEVESERIRLLQDLNGDGRADFATTFADGFKTSVSGVAAGVLARQSNVWFACIPDLWLLQDRNRDGHADFRQSLLHGFGVHISFGGHDLHGLCFGPDGKLYFSIADRGLNVKTAERAVAYPDSGAVMRCNPDGSEFEIVAFGLRNPQELAFDQFGNLWTGDNNGDGGDKARWVYVLEGSDSGWHLGWQHLPKMGAWNSERLWELPGLNTAAYILPPVAHIGHGPAGLAFYPGTGLPDRYLNHFFLCDFPGGVRSFALEPRGAAYSVTDLHDFLWELYPVDVGFSPSGGVYVADWIQGWEKTGKGRIFRVSDPSLTNSPIIRQTQTLLAEGMTGRSVRDLVKLLDHPDQRIRLEAQFSLAAQPSASTNALLDLANQRGPLLGRLHALWGIGQIARSTPEIVQSVLPLLSDGEAEVRAQAARILGDRKFTAALEPLARALQDGHPRVRLFAAFALGKLSHPEACDPIFEMLRANADEDPYLRHAGVTALTWLNDMDSLVIAAKDQESPVRLASLLAMRRLGRPELAMFLYDSDPRIVLEAARAVYDLPIEGALSQLAALASRPDLPDPVLRRALHANYRIGRLENALALATASARATAPDLMRAEALDLLAGWSNPPRRDPVVGLFRPLPARDARPALLALRSELAALLESPSAPVQAAAARAAGALQATTVIPALHELVLSENAASTVRIAALRSLLSLKFTNAQEVLEFAAQSSDVELRNEAGRLLLESQPSDAFAQILQTLKDGPLTSRQAALRKLGLMPGAAADEILVEWLDRLLASDVPRELHLDLLTAAAKRSSPNIQARLNLFEKARSRNDPLGPYQEVLLGGNAAAGRKLFFERADVACLRCHKLDGEGGEVGPELAGIGARQSRTQLLEAVLFPNRQIAPGYETILVTLKGGGSVAGQLKSENDTTLIITSPEDGTMSLEKSSIQSRDRGISAMPEEIRSLLSKDDLRDLIEFLAGLK